MTSPYSSNLLQHSDDEQSTAPRGAYPYAPQRQQAEGDAIPAEHQRPRVERTVQQQVVRYAPQPAPVQYAPQQQPQVVYVQAPGKRGGGVGGAVSGIALALVVVLVGAVALVGGYFTTKNNAPSELEAQAAVGIASDTAFVQGRLRGTEAGRTAAAEIGASRVSLNAAIARQAAEAKAYQQGLTAGNRVPSYSGYRGGYRSGGNGYRYSGPSQVQTALGYAQNLANATGAPVDVEVY